MPPNNRRNLELNPAFANAHGLSEATENVDPWNQLDKDLSNANSTLIKLAKAIEEARKSGKLMLSSIGLKLPLPKAMFEIRSDLIEAFDGTAIDVDDSEKFWECHGEETLTLWDMSDNDLSIKGTKGGEPAKLAMLDDRLQCYRSLQTLRIRNCNLNDLPWETIGEHLTSLRVLDAPGNKFSSVPLHLLPSTMNKLYLADNGIDSLGNSQETVCLPELIHLDLGNNALKCLPSTLDCAMMQHLILTNNKIESISPSFLNASRNVLKTLDLTKNRLTLEMDLSQHAELQFLDLRFNKLISIPKIHANLSRLDVSFNQISSISGMYEGHCNAEGKTRDGDWFRSKLTELHLEKNCFPNMDASILAVMTNLTLLNICSNDLENIPHVVGYLPKMEKLLLDGNPLRMIRNAIKYKTSGGIEVPKLLASLRNKGKTPSGPGYYGSNYENAQNVEVPKNVAEANAIVRKASCNKGVLDIGSRNLAGDLDWQVLVDALMAETTNSRGEETTFGHLVQQWVLSHGKLTSFGNEWIEALPNMSTLLAHRNHIDSLPTKFSQLYLKTLELKRNRINSSLLQDQICVPGSNLATALVTLDLSSNEIEWIPGSLFDLHKLESLNLSQNKIKSLQWDDEYGTGWRHGLVSLRHLDLSNNIISDLGYLSLALSGCKQLKTLLLNNNAIYRIPLELGLLTQLTNIDLLGNTQRQIRVRVLTQPCSQILNFLRDRLTPEELQEAKENHNEILMALEEEGLGKVDSAEGEGEGRDIAVDEGAQSKVKLVAADNKEKGSEGVQAQMKSNTNADATCNKGPSAEIIESLKCSINDLSEQVESLSISQAKRYALKKALAMERSKLRREERKLE